MDTDMVLPTSTCAGKVSRRFVPKTFRTQDESYPVQDESYPVDFDIFIPKQLNSNKNSDRSETEYNDWIIRVTNNSDNLFQVDWLITK